MTNKEMIGYIDHTLLKPYACWDDIKALCEEAVKYGTASVCVPPTYIARIHKAYPELNICTVVGFPLGYCDSEAKLVETKKALSDGAKEIDMVINISDVKNGDYQKVEDEIKLLKNAVGNNILKVIIETCFLTENEKIEMCKVVTRAKADYIKTSTGFGTGGATREDVKLFAENIGPDVKIKAAGGVKTIDDMKDFIELGASRIGSSSALALLI